MTPTPPVPAAPDHTGTDEVLAGLCQTSGDYLAGLIAAGTLDSVGAPGKLPELLWPDADPTLVRDIWMAGLTAGWRGAKLDANHWTPDALDRLRTALTDAGYTAMARLVQRSRNIHPADAEQHTARGHA